MNKKAQAVFYVMFFFMALIVVVIAAVLAPLGVRFNSEVLVFGEQMILESNDTISQIQDDTIRTNVQATLSEATAQTQNNIDVNAAIFQYGWVILLILSGLAIFIYQIRIKETTGGSGGVF